MEESVSGNTESGKEHTTIHATDEKGPDDVAGTESAIIPMNVEGKEYTHLAELTEATKKEGNPHIP